MPKYFIQHNDGRMEEITLPSSIVTDSDRSNNWSVSPKTITPSHKQLGVVVPLFVHPSVNEAAWTQLAYLAAKYPRIHVVAVVDVNNGPGLGPDAAIQEKIGMLKNQGVTVLGYIDTTNIVSPAETEFHMTLEMDNWSNWYHNLLDGFYYSTGARSYGAENNLRELDDYAKQKLGMKFTVLGTGVHEFASEPQKSLIETTGFNLFILYNGRGYANPITALKRGWMGDFPRSKFGMICTNIDATKISEAENFIRNAVGTQKLVGYIYLQTDSGARSDSNPFNSLSSLLESTLIQLDQIASTEGSPTPQEPGKPLTTIIPETPTTFSVDAASKREIKAGADDGDRDFFGIKKLYPDCVDKKRFQEWYLKQDRDITKDPRLKNWKNANLRRMQDNSQAWYCDGSGSKGMVRLEAWCESAKKPWLNTETTIYVYLIDVSKKFESGDYAYQVYCRSGHHSDKSPCEGAAYKSRLFMDGRTSVVKEVAHPFYSGNRGVGTATNLGVKGKWIGFKQVCYNVTETGEPNTWVVIENWIDDNCTDKDGNLAVKAVQNWKKIATVTDLGGWGVLKKNDITKLNSLIKKWKCKSVDSKRAGQLRQNHDIINTSGGNNKDGNCVSFRCDGVMVKFQNWSVREIQPNTGD